MHCTFCVPKSLFDGEKFKEEVQKIIFAILKKIEDEKLFHAMTKRARATDFSEETLTLTFESSFLAEHFRKNYSRRLEKAELKIFGTSIAVNVEE